MSLQRSNRKENEKSSFDGNQFRVKGSYTEEGFYRKNNNNADINFSNLSQKQSIYDHKYIQPVQQTTSQFGYSTLNPNKYPTESMHLAKEQDNDKVLQFQLKRQRQKNKILQVRLKNKEIFIAQMHEFQSQLATAFQKCQEQLQIYKKKCAQQADQAREYLEEITEMKHLLIMLQDKNQEYERRESKRYSSLKRDKEQENKKSISNFRDDSARASKISREKRSKTMVNQQDSSPEFKKFDIIEQYITKYPKKVANFISQFMGMVECFSEDAKKASKSEERHNVKRRLKIGWKWIKQTVAQWNNLNIYATKIQHFLKTLTKTLKISQGKNEAQTMQLIVAALRK